MKAFHVIDGDGEHFCVLADDFKSAYDKFREHQEKEFECPQSEIEDIQSMSPIGDVIQ